MQLDYSARQRRQQHAGTARVAVLARGSGRVLQEVCRMQARGRSASAGPSASAGASVSAGWHELHTVRVQVTVSAHVAGWQRRHCHAVCVGEHASRAVSTANGSKLRLERSGSGPSGRSTAAPCGGRGASVTTAEHGWLQPCVGFAAGQCLRLAMGLTAPLGQRAWWGYKGPQRRVGKDARAPSTGHFSACCGRQASRQVQARDAAPVAQRMWCEGWRHTRGGAALRVQQ